jgi:hypothetical protein
MNISDILTKYYPDKPWTINNEDYNTLEWYDSSPKPTFEELQRLNEPLLVEKAKEEECKRCIREGFKVEPENFRMALTQEQLLFSTVYLNTIQEGFALKKYDKKSMGKLKDTKGVVHELTLERIREILFSYLEYYISIKY